ncbi:DUF4434 domain-containing protein [Pedobacter sp. HDW13]|uniref:glycoside hydrolase family 2 TIM barrel-domain containing protein n=1 Tax=Pedobacter sp. HDW13 TaxID=2714940 RepID=UPI00140A8FC2|nr:glycoside hydrolase family 2 TIM barrel-domain containing protein [Pedobacter sp. HDW13]QIL38344.1 DUF4434 domain-containing protein [Pedobacter sp. HDW13]
MKTILNQVLLISVVISVFACKRNRLEVKETPTTPTTVVTDTVATPVPFLVKGIFAANIPDMRRAASYGFNVVHSYQFSSMNNDQIKAYMDSAARYNLKVHFHLGVKTYSATIFDRVKAQVSQYKNHPAIYSWYLSDEPSVKEISVAELKSVYDWIKQTDREHPVYTSNWELENFKTALDYDMPQFYNGPPSALRKGNYLNGYMARAARLGVKWVGIANTHDCIDFAAYHLPGAEVLSPDFMRSKVTPGSPEEATVLQKIRNIQANLQNPPYQTLGTFPDTRDKIRGQAWDLIARGSNGLWYWLLQPENSLHERWGYYTFFLRPALRTAFAETLKEVTDLWPRVHTPLQNSSNWLSGPSSEVFFWFRKSGNQITIIAVNESESVINVQTKIPALSGYSSKTFQVNGENRSVQVENGNLSDSFKPNETHIYLLTL